MAELFEVVGVVGVVEVDVGKGRIRHREQAFLRTTLNYHADTKVFDRRCMSCVMCRFTKRQP